VNSPRQTFVFDDTAKMADFFTARWCEIASGAIRKRGSFVVALSGGKTPAPFYRRLARERGEGAQWNKTHIFFVDERFVSATDADSNYRMIKETLLDSAGVPAGNVHPIPTDLSDPMSAALRYERDVAFFFGDRIPEFDLIVLGIGTDGHTASLFPGNQVLKEEKQLVTAVFLGRQMHNRITLTLPVLNKARNVIFLVAGKEKAKVLREVLQSSDLSLPALLVAPEKGSVLYLADSGAGSLLRKKEGKGR
jgi:6-phosphogluconolactonase